MLFCICCLCELELPAFSHRNPAPHSHTVYTFPTLCLIVVVCIHFVFNSNRCPRPRRTCRSSASSTPSRTRCSPACRPATTRSDRRKSAPSYSTDTSPWVIFPIHACWLWIRDNVFHSWWKGDPRVWTFSGSVTSQMLINTLKYWQSSISWCFLPAIALQLIFCIAFHHLLIYSVFVIHYQVENTICDLATLSWLFQNKL